MGYTHYWTFKELDKDKEKKLEKIEKQYQLALKDCRKIIRHYYDEHKGTEKSLSGFTAHQKDDKKYGGLSFNGARGNLCEDFSLATELQENYNNYDTFSGDGFNFCKTRQYYYDQVVTACLIALKHRLKDFIDISSDGTSLEWLDGLRLAKKVLKKDYKIPFEDSYTTLINSKVYTILNEVGM